MFGCYNNKELENCSVGESLSWQQAIACQVPQQSYRFALITDYQAWKGQQVWGNLITIFTSHCWWQWAVQRRTAPQPFQVGQESNAGSRVSRMVEDHTRGRMSPTWLNNGAPAPTTRSLQQGLHCLSLPSPTFCTGFQQPWCRVFKFPFPFPE